MARSRQEVMSDLEETVASFDWVSITPGKKSALHAFMRLSTSKGYEAVTMRNLAQLLDIKPPSLYSHFPGGKDELVRLALRWHFTNWSKEVVETIKEVKDPSEALERIIAHHVRGQLEEPGNDMFDLMLAADRISRTFPQEVRAEADHVIGLYHELISTVLHDLGSTGDSDRAAALTVSILDSVRSWSDWDGSDSTTREVTDYASRAIRRATGLL